jgi:thymidine kinase
MGASKSARVIETAFNLNRKGIKVEVIKPAFDQRDSDTEIVSRNGTRTPAVAMKNLAEYYPGSGTKFLLIDEVQFFTPSDIDRLVDISDMGGVITMCYGLMTDSNEEIFEASKRLIEVGAKLHLLECPCEIPECSKLATHNLRLDDKGTAIRYGAKFELGSSNYKGVCRNHFYEYYYNREK